MSAKTSAEPSDLQTEFRNTMAQVCTPVSVITAMDGKRPHGTTVSAFASLSMNPPMMLVSLDRGSELLPLLQEEKCFGVNILGVLHTDLARGFARRGADRFADVQWREEHGAPRLVGSPGWLACRVVRWVDGGDHVIVLGEVISADSTSTPPLTYHARTFGTHAPHREASESKGTP